MSMEGLIQIMPDCIIPCCDVWQRGKLDAHKMQAYKALQDEGTIARLHATYNKSCGMTIVEYMSSLPHAWTKDALRERAAKILNGQAVTQQKMEV